MLGAFQRLAVRLRAVGGLTIAQLRYKPGWTLLAIVGIAVAVLSMTLLASVGIGVVDTGQEKFASADRDLWVTGGPVQLAPGRIGGFKNSIHDAHNLSEAISRRDDVQTAVPLSFQTVYASRTPSAEDPQTVVAVGIPSDGGLRIQGGPGFTQPSRHYADGAYDGRMSSEVIIDPRVARSYNVTVNDTLFVGGTVAGMVRNNRTVVGITGTLSRFLGAPTVVLPLAELQTMTGTAHVDSATMLTVSLTEGADSTAVKRELEEAYPSLDVRTNREQLQAVLAQKAVIIASGGVLVVLAVVAGLALVVNLLALLVHQQRHEIAALRALGVSTSTLVAIMASQGLLLSLAGGAIGLGLTPVLATVLNRVAAELVGFEGLVRTPEFVFFVGGAGAIVFGVVSAVVATTRVASIEPLSVLRE
jgi:putative ABC transport system permease protein